MTDRQIEYNINSRHARTIGLAMESWVEELHYQEKLCNYQKMQIAKNQLDKLRSELDLIWDRQIELFFEMRDEYEKEKEVRHGSAKHQDQSTDTELQGITPCDFKLLEN